LTKQYKVVWRSFALKELKKIDQASQRRLIAAAKILSDNPFPPNSKKVVGPHEIQRIRVGDYRLLYKVEEVELIVLVVKVGHRRNVYRRLTL
jgi:mRNA interferase RelE/StbE